MQICLATQTREFVTSLGTVTKETSFEGKFKRKNEIHWIEQHYSNGTHFRIDNQ